MTSAWHLRLACITLCQTSEHLRVRRHDLTSHMSVRTYDCRALGNVVPSWLEPKICNVPLPLRPPSPGVWQCSRWARKPPGGALTPGSSWMPTSPEAWQALGSHRVRLPRPLLSTFPWKYKMGNMKDPAAKCTARLRPCRIGCRWRTLCFICVGATDGWGTPTLRSSRPLHR